MNRDQDVRQILGVDPINDNRCAGLRRDGMSCNNVVAAASRKSALTILRQCVGLPADSAELRSNFKTAARLLLCKRNHQDQWSALRSEWLRAWSAHERSVARTRTTNRARTETSRQTSRSTSSSSSRIAALARSSEDATNDTINLLHTILASQLSDRAKLDLLNLQMGVINAPSNSPNRGAITGRVSAETTANNELSDSEESDSDGPSDEDSGRDTDADSEQDSDEDTRPIEGHRHNVSDITLSTHNRPGFSFSSPPSATTTPRLTPRASRTPANLPSSTATNSQRGSTSTHGSAPRQSTTRRTLSDATLSTEATTRDIPSDRVIQPRNNTPQNSSTSAESSRPRQKLTASLPASQPPGTGSPVGSVDSADVRHSHVECMICMEAYTGSMSLHWECHECQNRVHNKCNLEWRARQSPRPASCPYCREPQLGSLPGVSPINTTQSSQRFIT